MEVLFCQNKEYRDWVWIWDVSTPEKKRNAILDMWAKTKDTLALQQNVRDTSIFDYKKDIERLMQMKNDMEEGKIPDYFIEETKKEVSKLKYIKQNLSEVNFSNKMFQKANEGNAASAWDYMIDALRHDYEFDFVDVIEIISVSSQ